MVLGNNNFEDETLFKMQKAWTETRDVEIPCVLITNSAWNEVKMKIAGHRNGTVIATISPEQEMDDENWWVLPTVTQFLTYLVIILPATWVILTIHHFCQRDLANRRNLGAMRNRIKLLPQVVYTKDL